MDSVHSSHSFKFNLWRGFSGVRIYAASTTRENAGIHSDSLCTKLRKLKGLWKDGKTAD